MDRASREGAKTAARLPAAAGGAFLGSSPLRRHRGDLTERAFALQEKYRLLTNDAVVLAVALRLKADCLVSRDKGFGGVNELDLYFPTNLRL